MRLARKIEFIKNRGEAAQEVQDAVSDLKKKKSSLGKLQVIGKVPQGERCDGSLLFQEMQRVVQKDLAAMGISSAKKKAGVHKHGLGDLVVPYHLYYQMKGEMMDDPVMLESGQTYERAYIEKYFSNKRERLEEDKDDSDLDEATYFTCPVSQQPVNPDIILPNKRVKQATEDFIEQNPWSFEFDPTVDFHTIHVWD